MAQMTLRTRDRSIEISVPIRGQRVHRRFGAHRESRNELIGGDHLAEQPVRQQRAKKPF